jgi:hypothetical protein
VIGQTKQFSKNHARDINYIRLIHRKSYVEINRTYFFTASIHQWLPLLDSKAYKELIINYVKELSDRKFIKVYSFVIMPAHIISFGNSYKKWKRNAARKGFEIYGPRTFKKAKAGRSVQVL